MKESFYATVQPTETGAETEWCEAVLVEYNEDGSDTRTATGETPEDAAGNLLSIVRGDAKIIVDALEKLAYTHGENVSIRVYT